MNYNLPLLAIAFACATTAVDSRAENSFTDAIKNGEAKLDFRLRFEDVDQDRPVNKEGDALTLRTRLNYQTAAYKGFTASLEVDDVSAWDNNSYNNTLNGETDKATIADPTDTEINQAWIKYVNGGTEAKFGRQRINLDNQRFVGGVGFRQNEQTYDSFSLKNSSIADTSIFYAYINKVNRIFGEDSPVGEHESDTHLVNIKYSGLKQGSITGYAYLIDNEDLPRFSTDTYGLRFAGSTSSDDIKFGYTLEYARQSDSDNNTLSYDADYLLGEASATVSGVSFKLGYELLGSDDGVASFITPLATLHKFQGWTDQFLATPAQGIADTYVSIGGKWSGIKLLAVYHDFESDEDNGFGDEDLGSEFGVMAAKQFGSYGISIKYASYDSGDSSFGKVDTDKLWVTATAKF